MIKGGQLEPGTFIQVILGLRQVGKTTMITQLLSQISTPYLFESADAVLVLFAIL